MPGPRHVRRTGSAGRLRAAHVRPLPRCGIFIVCRNGKRARSGQDRSLQNPGKRYRREGLDPSAQVFDIRSIHPLRPGSWQQQRGGQIRKIQRQTPPTPAPRFSLYLHSGGRQQAPAPWRRRRGLHNCGTARRRAACGGTSGWKSAAPASGSGSRCSKAG